MGQGTWLEISTLTSNPIRTQKSDRRKAMKLNQFSDAVVQSQAVAAGFATVELYIQSLLERDADRLAIPKGIDALEAGQHRPFDEFDREFREKNGSARHNRQA